MENIYLLFMFVIGVIIAIGVGLEISKEIDEFIIYMLFWMLYIITIITFVNIILVGNYYLTMRHKTGAPGRPGEPGIRGDKGDTGLCDVTCRDTICENEINDMILQELIKRNKGVNIKINNVYIKSKVRLMCGSDEFKQLAPYNGPYNLINYIKEIWKLWFDLIYDSGGLKYFENVGVESDFDWLRGNPFDELKKYDVFYWGMGKQYRPEIIDKCYSSTNGDTPNNSYIVKTSTSNNYESLGNDSGSGAYNSVSFWRARQHQYKSNTFYPVGDIAMGPRRDNDNISSSDRKVGVFNINGLSNGPLRTTLLVSGDVQGPMDYQLIWTNKKFWVWRPIPPSDYIALGDVVTFTKLKLSTGDSAPIRCVPKDMANRIQNDGNVFWSSLGSRGANSDVTLLGFNPNNGTAVNGTANNAYNLFRAVVGNNTIIPSTDVNGSFYRLDTSKYDSSFVIGNDTPTTGNSVGKGFLLSKKKDAKYSVMAYLNLKNNVTLTHNISLNKFSANLVPNAISNAYQIRTNTDPKNNRCIDFDNNIVTTPQPQCDELVDTQIFSIMLTGNKKNECRLQHYNTKKYIKYKNGMITLIDEYDTNDMDSTLFIMS